jgi:hypothetical protein
MTSNLTGHPPLELLTVESMASGHRSLRLTDQVSWEDFPRYAKALLGVLDGSIDGEADSPVERVWTVTIRGASFWLSFDDFGLGVSLDARNAEASSLIPVVRDDLVSYRARVGATG